jgi:RNA polymerase sigma-70 factor (ECF subfamily)
MDDARNAQDRWVAECLGRYEAPLTRYAARILGDGHGARDVVQETFLRLCSQESTSLNGRLRPWLYTVCRRLALDELRKEGRMLTPGETTIDARESGEADPAATVEQRDTAALAERALASLPRNQRECIELKLRHGLRYREIAEVTGLSLGNVGFLIQVGTRSLRERMSRGGAL